MNRRPSGPLSSEPSQPGPAMTTGTPCWRASPNGSRSGTTSLPQTVVTLARLVGTTTAEQVVRLTERVFGGEPLTERGRAVIADLDDTLQG